MRVGRWREGDREMRAWSRHREGTSPGGDCHPRGTYRQHCVSAATLSFREKPRKGWWHKYGVYRSSQLIFRCEDSMTF